MCHMLLPQMFGSQMSPVGPYTRSRSRSNYAHSFYFCANILGHEYEIRSHSFMGIDVAVNESPLQTRNRLRQLKLTQTDQIGHSMHMADHNLNMSEKYFRKLFMSFQLEEGQNDEKNVTNFHWQRSIQLWLVPNGKWKFFHAKLAIGWQASKAVGNIIDHAQANGKS